MQNSTQRSDRLKEILREELRGRNDEVLNNKISQLAKVVSKMNDGNGPDIVGVCEVGNISLLQVCTGLEWRTKLLADLATKESETIFDQKDLVLNSLKCQKRECF